jgi:glycopeptide antibiotics resistance protein
MEQEQPTQPTDTSVPSEPTPTEVPAEPTPDGYEKPGWSWGGFMEAPILLIASRRYVYLLLYVLLFVPFVNVFAWLGISVFFGLKGREIAAESKTFTSREQYVGFMKGIDHAGKMLFYATLIVAVIAIVLALTGVMFLGEGLDAHHLIIE